MVIAQHVTPQLSRTTYSKRVRIFLASPGDVGKERELARAVIDKLRNEFRYKDRIKFETVAWDQPGAAVAQEATLTPQMAIAKGLPKPSECDLVIVVLWSRMGTPLPAVYTKSDGSRYLSGTEWELCDAMEAATNHRHPAVWLYRCTQIPTSKCDDPQYEEIKQQWNRVQTFFDVFTGKDNEMLGGINKYHDPAEFGKLLEDHLRNWVDRHISEFVAQPPPLSPIKQILNNGKTSSWPGTPYPGLRAFIPNEAPIFFGRQIETQELIDKLSQPDGRFVAVVGASGCGKSSLVAAGLLPALKNSAIEGSEHWIIVRLKPAEIDNNPFMALAVQLIPKLEKHGWRASDLAAQLYEIPSLFTERLSAQLRDANISAADILLVIDQFEELFTRCAPNYRQQFIDLLTLVAESEQMRVVVTLRADYYHNCLNWPALATLLEQGTYSLSAPGVTALLEMIQSPAQLVGMSFEHGLTDCMLQDTSNAPGRLALVAFALEKLYEAGKAERLLTLKAYQSFEGVRGAIAQKADDTYSKLEHKGVDVATALGQIFRELVTIDLEHNLATSKDVPLSRFNGDALLLLNALVDARLLVSDKKIVEVAHEVIFESWPRLKNWIEISSDDIKLYKSVKSEAYTWANTGYDYRYLKTHEQLELVYGMFNRFKINRLQLDEPLKSYVRPHAERLLEELEIPATDHYRRAAIGDELNKNYDQRYGVGVNASGIPQIYWVDIRGGNVSLKPNGKTHKVDPLYIAKYPVTYLQYRAFLSASDGYYNIRWWHGLRPQNKPGEQYRPFDNHPVDTVSWYDAIAFCRWLSVQLNYDVRLPTEYEWQQAATDGDPKNIYPWGTKWNGNLTNTDESHLSRTTAVGMYPKGATGGQLCGVMDMAGGVWEWCLNKYDTPADCSISGNEPRVLRGGSWGNDQEFARSTFRLHYYPHSCDNNVGFRLCCKPPKL